MFEQEAETIARIVHERAMGGLDALRMDAFVESGAPSAVKHYVQACVVQDIERDLIAGIRSGHIDFNDPATGRLIVSYARSLASLRVFGREELLQLLRQATLLLCNYVCRPRWTLEEMAFEGKDIATTDAILDRIQGLSDYKYLVMLLEKVMARRRAGHFGRLEFRALLAGLDNEVVRQHNAAELAQLARPIFEFFGLCSTTQGSISLHPVLAFYDDKGMNALKQYIESICHIRGRTDITSDELVTLVEDLYSGHTSPTAVSPPPDVPAAAESSTGHEEAPPPETEPPPVTPPPEPQKEPEGNQGSPGRKNIALSLTFAGLQESHAAAKKLPELKMLITDDERSRFITHVFRNDDDYYAGVIATLNDMENWKEASLYLNDFFQLNDLDPFSEIVIEFTDAIQRRFDSPGERT